MQDKNGMNSKTNEKKKFSEIKGFSSFTSALMAIVIGLLFGFIVMLLANPNNAVAGFRYVLLGGLGRFGDVLYFATPILMTGLSVAFAFKNGLI
jgi:nucleoside ABC transporter membrane protein